MCGMRLGDTCFLDESEAIPEDIRTALGIARTVRVHRRELNAYGYVHLETSRGYHKRGVDRFDPSIHIEWREEQRKPKQPEHEPRNPVKLDDGSYYFEAIECIRGTGKELLWNHLALCPLCAAKYRHANGTQPEEIKRRVLAARTTEVPITLVREEKTIWFTKVHLLDLQTALHEV